MQIKDKKMSDSLVYVYKSEKKSGRYLYLKNKDMFSLVPNELLNAFGTLKYVMMFALSNLNSCHPSLQQG